MIITKAKFLENIYLFIACIPLLVYAIIVFKYTTNSPFLDDLFWGIYNLNDYIKFESIVDKINHVFKQHNQHKMAFFKGILAFYYEFFGELNFKALAILGNISNLIVFITAAISLKSIKKSLFFLIPISFLLFQVQYYFNIILTFSFPNQSVYAWALITFYLVSLDKPKWFYLALFTGFLATFSNGNGILVFPLILFFFGIQKNWRSLFLTVFIGAITFLIYFKGFVSNSEEITFTKKNVLFFFNLLRSGFSTSHKPYELIFMAICLTVYISKVAYDLYQIVFKNQGSILTPSWIFLNSTLIWILGSAALVSLFRGASYSSIPNWYFNYSVLFGIFFLIWILYHIKHKVLLGLVGAFSLYFSFEVFVASYVLYLNPISYLHSQLKADEYNFRLNKKFSFFTLQFGPENYNNCNLITNKFLQSDIYRPAILPAKLSKISDNVTFADLKKSTEVGHKTGYSFSLSENNYVEKDEVFGFIKSTEKLYLFGTEQKTNPSKRAILSNFNPFQNDFKFLIDPTYSKFAIERNEYMVGYVVLKKNGDIKWFLSEKVQIKN